MRRSLVGFFALSVLFAGQSTVSAQGRKVTIDWIYSAEAFAVDVAPSSFWTADGTALVFDERNFEAGIQRLDPKSGKSVPALDARAAFKSLRQAGCNIPALLWPEGFDKAGKRALYADGADVFVLDMTTGTASRVTNSPDVEEKSPRISPSGEKVAWVTGNNLFVHDLASAKTTQLTDDGSATLLNGTLSWVYWEEVFGRQDIGYWFSDDSKSIVFLKTDESVVPEVTYVDFKPATPRVLTQRYPKAGDKNPIVSVHVAELDGDAKAAPVDLGEKAFEYVARVVWHPDSQKFVVETLNRAQDELDVRLVDKKEKKAKIILTEKDAAWINIHDDLVFLKKSPEFLWVSERTGYAHIYRYDLDGKLLGQVTSGEWAVRDTGAVYWLHQAIKAIDEEKGFVYFNALKKSSIENHVYRAKLDGSELTQLTEDRGIHAPRFSQDAAFFFDEHTNSETPTHLTLKSADGKVVKEVAPSFTETIKDLALAYPEFVTVPAQDGFKMPGMIFKPKDFDPTKRYPVILYVYGGPAAPTVLDKFNANDLFWNQVLLDQGYIVASIDNRSATAQSKKTENAILGQMYGDSELNDLVDAVKWLKAQPYIDPARVGIWGWSGGGSMTILGMTRSEEFKAGIAVAGVTRWEYYDTKWGEASMKTPQTNPKGYKSTDLTRRAKNLSGKLMLVHGTYDDNVHIQNTWHFIDELVKAGKIFELQVYPMRQHGIADLPARLHLFKTMLDFWKRNL